MQTIAYLDQLGLARARTRLRCPGKTAIKTPEAYRRRFNRKLTQTDAKESAGKETERFRKIDERGQVSTGRVKSGQNDKTIRSDCYS